MRDDVWEAPADHGEGATDAAGPRWIRKRRERRGYLGDVNEEGLHSSDALEVLRDLVHRKVGGDGATAAEELVGDEDVLRHLDGVLEQAVDVDHIHADELLSALDGLASDFPDVRDELQFQAAGLRAALAGADVELDKPTLRVEGAMHGDGRVGDGGHRCRSVQSVGVARQEGRVALDLDQVKASGSVDDLVEHASRGRLRVSEHAAVKVHVLRVAADVGDQEQCTTSRHGGTVSAERGLPALDRRPDLGAERSGWAAAAG